MNPYAGTCVDCGKSLNNEEGFPVGTDVDLCARCDHLRATSPVAKVELFKDETQLVVDILNSYLDDDIDVLHTKWGRAVSVKALLRRVLIAGIKSKQIQLPACFQGDEELLEAAGRTKDPDPETRH